MQRDVATTTHAVFMIPKMMYGPTRKCVGSICVCVWEWVSWVAQAAVRV